MRAGIPRDRAHRPRTFSVSVIVCAHNEATYLAACLHSLLAQTRPPDELLVIDNASTDGTGDLREHLRP